MPSPPLELRRAWPVDAAALADIRRRAILELATPAMGVEAARAWADNAAPDHVSKAIAEHEVWVAVRLGEPVGWVEFAGDFIGGAYVAPEAAGQGVGRALIRHAEGRIRGSGYPLVRLEASSNAVAFYRRLGFSDLGEPDGYGTLPMGKPYL